MSVTGKGEDDEDEDEDADEDEDDDVAELFSLIICAAFSMPVRLG